MCLNINIKQIRKATSVESVRRHLAGLFGDDLIDFVVVGDWISDDSVESCGDSYVFIKTCNYHSHVKALRASRMVSGVLDSYDAPIYVDEQDVVVFREKMAVERMDPLTFHFGDVVKVREGYLKGLHGVVCDPTTHKTCNVLFKFFTRSILQKLSVKNIELKGSVFDHIKFPVTKQKDYQVILDRMTCLFGDAT